MTVAELIDLLRDIPPERRIWVQSTNVAVSGEIETVCLVAEEDTRSDSWAHPDARVGDVCIWIYL